MELQRITETIIQEAKRSAELIIKEAEEMADAINEKQRELAVKKAKIESALMIKKAVSDTEVELQRKLANAKITANWIVLSKKEHVISEVLNEAMKRLQNIEPKSKYISVLEKLITEAGIVLGGKELEVMVNEIDSALVLKLGDIAEEIGRITGFETKLKISEKKLETAGGVTLVTASGKIVMDNTFEGIIDRKKEEIKSKISMILFQ